MRCANARGTPETSAGWTRVPSPLHLLLHQQQPVTPRYQRLRTRSNTAYAIALLNMTPLARPHQPTSHASPCERRLVMPCQDFGDEHALANTGIRRDFASIPLQCHQLARRRRCHAAPRLLYVPFNLFPDTRLIRPQTRCIWTCSSLRIHAIDPMLPKP